MSTLSRRDLLKLGAVGAGATAAGVLMPLGESARTADWVSTAPRPARFARRLHVPQAIAPTLMSDAHGDYLLYEISERTASAQLLDPGAPPTPVLGYAAGADAPTVPGPLIKVDQHTRVRVRVRNELPTTHPAFGYGGIDTSVHLHGSASLPQYDGYADDVTSPGHHKDYWYPNHQAPGRSGTTTTAGTTPPPTPTAVCSRSTTSPMPGNGRTCLRAGMTSPSSSPMRCSPRTAGWPTWTATTPDCGGT